MEAIGMIETRGLVAAIEAADTMLKAAKCKNGRHRENQLRNGGGHCHR